MEEALNEKIEYLKTYRTSTAKIKRVRQMMEDCPEYRDRYSAMLKSAQNTRIKLEDEIDSVDGGILSEILSQKYICGKSLEEVGYCVNYSKRQVERLHLKALEKFKIT